MADETITRDQFAQLALKIMLAHGRGGWIADAAKFSLINHDGQSQEILSLNRMYQDYLGAESPNNLLNLQRTIRLLINPKPLPAAKNELQALLLPCLRTLIDFQISNLQTQAMPEFQGAANELAYCPYADVLAVGLIFDKGETIRHARYSELELAKLGFEQALDVAVKNLEQKSVHPFRLVQAGFYTSAWKDYHDGARLLLPELFSKLQVKGEVVALTPLPDTLFVTGSEDLIGLELMTSLGSSLMRSPNAVAVLPLVLRGGAWEPFTVPVDHTVFDTVNSYRQNILKLLFDKQQGLLTGASSGDASLFVGPFTLQSDESRGFLYSKTSVLAGSVCAIPEADVVEFFAQDAGGKKVCVARAPFTEVGQLMKHDLKQDSLLEPHRWYFERFPSAAEISSLGMMAEGQAPQVSTVNIEESGLAVFEELLSLPIPDEAQLDGELEEDGNSFEQKFVIQCTVEDLTKYYYAALPIGGFEQISTKQGAFFRAGVYGASCTREVLFGPSKKRGQSLLQLSKTVDFGSLALENALIKQSDLLLALEQFFGFSIPESSTLEANFRPIEKGAQQNFYSGHSPDSLVQFFRTQMIGPRPLYIPGDQNSPHVLMDLDLEIVISIATKQMKQGTFFSISKSWEKSTSGKL